MLPQNKHGMQMHEQTCKFKKSDVPSASKCHQGRECLNKIETDN